METIILPILELIVDENLKVTFLDVELIRIHGMNNKEWIVNDNRILMSTFNFSKFLPHIKDRHPVTLEKLDIE